MAGKYQKGQETIIIRVSVDGEEPVNAFKSSGGVQYMAAGVEREDTIGGYTEREVNSSIEGSFCVPCEISQKTLGSMCGITITATFSCKVITFRDAWVSAQSYDTGSGNQTLKFSCVPENSSEELIDTETYNAALLALNNL